MTVVDNSQLNVQCQAICKAADLKFLLAKIYSKKCAICNICGICESYTTWCRICLEGGVLKPDTICTMCQEHKEEWFGKDYLYHLRWREKKISLNQ